MDEPNVKHVPIDVAHAIVAEWLGVSLAYHLPKGTWIRYAGRSEWHHLGRMGAYVAMRHLREGDVVVKVD